MKQIKAAGKYKKYHLFIDYIDINRSADTNFINNTILRAINRQLPHIPVTKVRGVWLYNSTGKLIGNLDRCFNIFAYENLKRSGFRYKTSITLK